jgi:hypothetical protein
MKINKLDRQGLNFCGYTAQFFFVQKQWRKMSEKVELKSTKKIAKENKSRKNNNVTVKTLNFTQRTFFFEL